MKASLIAAAIEALNSAGKALRGGDLSIPAQMRLGLECYRAADGLLDALQGVDVPIESAARPESAPGTPSSPVPGEAADLTP